MTACVRLGIFHAADAGEWIGKASERARKRLENVHVRIRTNKMMIYSVKHVDKCCYINKCEKIGLIFSISVQIENRLNSNSRRTHQKVNLSIKPVKFICQPL